MKKHIVFFILILCFSLTACTGTGARVGNYMPSAEELSQRNEPEIESKDQEERMQDIDETKEIGWRYKEPALPREKAPHLSYTSGLWEWGRWPDKYPLDKLKKFYKNVKYRLHSTTYEVTLRDGSIYKVNGAVISGLENAEVEAKINDIIRRESTEWMGEAVQSWVREYETCVKVFYMNERYLSLSYEVYSPDPYQSTTDVAYYSLIDVKKGELVPLERVLDLEQFVYLCCINIEETTGKPSVIAYENEYEEKLKYIDMTPLEYFRFLNGDDYDGIRPEFSGRMSQWCLCEDAIYIGWKKQDYMKIGIEDLLQIMTDEFLEGMDKEIQDLLQGKEPGWRYREQVLPREKAPHLSYTSKLWEEWGDRPDKYPLDQLDTFYQKVNYRLNETTYDVALRDGGSYEVNGAVISGLENAELETKINDVIYREFTGWMGETKDSWIREYDTRVNVLYMNERYLSLCYDVCVRDDGREIEWIPVPIYSLIDIKKGEVVALESILDLEQLVLLFCIHLESQTGKPSVIHDKNDYEEKLKCVDMTPVEYAKFLNGEDYDGVLKKMLEKPNWCLLDGAIYFKWEIQRIKIDIEDLRQIMTEEFLESLNEDK